MPSIHLIKVFAILLALCPMSSPSAMSQTIYVNGTCGDNSWTGTSDVCKAPNGPKKSIAAGMNAALDGGEVVIADGVYTGPGNRGITTGGKSLTIRSMNGPAATVVDCALEHRFLRVVDTPSPGIMIRGLTVRNGFAELGGAIHCDASALHLVNCAFEDNEAAVGGALRIFPESDVTTVACVFAGNQAEGGAGLFNHFSNVHLLNCLFIDNHAESLGGGAVIHDAPAQVHGCSFVSNNSNFSTGGIVHNGDLAPSGSTFIHNCSFGTNSSTESGAVTLSYSDAALANSVAWANVPTQISLEFGTQKVTVNDSNIQGGWSGPGSNNIDADPLFVQPASGDLRLSFGSPCIDMGDTSALPPDEFDLDGDGDTDEPLPVDLAGMPRVQNGVVDMGAYEGEYEALPPMAETTDLDLLETEILIPTGGSFDPLAAPVAVVTNASGPDDSSYSVTQYAANIHAGAAGYSELSHILATESSLQPGQLFARLFIPFDQFTLASASAFDLDITTYDPALGAWIVGVARNSQSSPGHDSPIGDRIVVEGTDTKYGLTADLGDYGVFWNPSLQKGFVWANVDVADDFGAGISLCNLDCAPNNGDGVVDASDVAAILGGWGQVSGGEACDFDANCIIGPFDLAQALAGWGPCQADKGGIAGAAPSPPLGPVDPQQLAPSWGPCADGSPCDGDFNSDRRIDSYDLASLLAAWGDCETCPADLDRSGKVDRDDLDRLLGKTR